MNKTERLTYEWLKCKGYSEADITFRATISPDFLTSDGLAWETKLVRNGTVMFTLGQVESLANCSCTVVLHEEGKTDPVALYRFDELVLPGRHGKFRFVVPPTGQRATTVRLPDELWKTVRLRAIDTKDSAGAIVERALLKEIASWSTKGGDARGESLRTRVTPTTSADAGDAHPRQTRGIDKGGAAVVHSADEHDADGKPVRSGLPLPRTNARVGDRNSVPSGGELRLPVEDDSLGGVENGSGENNLRRSEEAAQRRQVPIPNSIPEKNEGKQGLEDSRNILGRGLRSSVRNGSDIPLVDSMVRTETGEVLHPHHQPEVRPVQGIGASADNAHAVLTRNGLTVEQLNDAVEHARAMPGVTSSIQPGPVSTPVDPSINRMKGGHTAETAGALVKQLSDELSPALKAYDRFVQANDLGPDEPTAQHPYPKRKKHKGPCHDCSCKDGERGAKCRYMACECHA